MTEIVMLALLGLTASWPCLGAILVRICSMREAYAWDLQTHDKMTCYSLELLRNQKLSEMENITLLGWVLAEIDSLQGVEREVYEKHLEWELRRGSIEEDMNSHLINILELARHVVSGISTGVSTAPVAVAAALGFVMPWKAALVSLAVYLASYKGTSYLEEIEALEGTNGCYHFYNPSASPKANPTRGLSEPVWVLIWVDIFGIGKVGRPAPSAKSRAFETGGSWPLDNENRNYSLLDATRFYRDGICNLAFYSMGRVLHLLQDMAVPAHVRDDSHIGFPIGEFLLEPADPLEKYAENRDWEWPEADNSVKWSFYPSRTFKRNRDQFVKRAAKWWRESSRESRPENIFDELAKWTHEECYSRGTIPGNADSHDPNNSEITPLAGKPDWRKCEPNTELLWAILNKFFYYPPAEILHSIEEMLRQDQWLIRRHPDTIPGIPGGYGTDFPEGYEVHGSSVPEMYGRQLDYLLNQNRAVKRVWEQSLKPLAEKKGPRTSADLHAYLKAVDEIYNSLCETIEMLKDKVAPTAVEAVRLESIKRQYVEKIQAWISLVRPVFRDITLLVESAVNNPGKTDKEVLKDWVEREVKRESPDVLVRFFRSYETKDKSAVSLDPWYPEGPCCLGEKKDRNGVVIGGDIIIDQYNLVFPRAVCDGALFLANWFEMLYWHGRGYGIGTWKNSSPDPHARIMLSHSVQEEIAENSRVQPYYYTHRAALPLGFNHHLPVALDFTVEIELDFETEEDEESFADIVLRILPVLSGLLGDTPIDESNLDAVEFNINNRKASFTVEKAVPYNYSLLNDVFKIPGESIIEAHTPSVPQGDKKIEPRGGIRKEQCAEILPDIRLDRLPGRSDSMEAARKYASYLLDLDFELEVSSKTL